MGNADRPDAADSGLAMIDGHDALAFVVIRPGTDGKVLIEAAANGLTPASAAHVLRHVADQWDGQGAAQPDEDGRTE
jgi:hypothetical protein